MRYRLGVAVLVIALLATTATAFAQTGSGYDLTWNTVDGGGGTAAGSGYTLDGTLGQFDAAVMSGGGYILGGGFWMNMTPLVTQFRVYLPLLLK